MEKVPIQISVAQLTSREAMTLSRSTLFMILQGTIRSSGEMGECTLSRSDLMFLREGETVSLSGEAEVLQLYLDENFLGDHLPMDTHQIFCCTPLGTGDDTALRQRVSELSMELLTGGKYNKVMSLCYGLLDLLSGYLVPVHLESEQQRKYAIARYLRQNYRSPLSLQQLAEHFYLSPQYLSRYVKKTFGQGFLSILTEIRMEGAIEELIQGGSNITQAALNHGFPNISSFNNAFRQKYGMSPKAYLKTQTPGESAIVSNTDAGLITGLLAEFLPQSYTPETVEEQHQTVEADSLKKEDYRKSWQYLINLEQAASLLDNAVQRHVEMAQNDLQFSYGRIINIISPDIFPNLESGGLTNFTQLNRVIDFMLSINLKPFIELQPKPIIKPVSAQEFQVEEPMVISESNWKRYMHELFTYLCKRWGEDEVETWRFELWMSHNEALEITPLERKRYVRRFQSTMEILKSYIPEGKLGGPGLNLGVSSLTALEDILALMQEAGVEPDFFSAYFYPTYISSFHGKKVRFQRVIGGDTKSWPELWERFHRLVAEAFPAAKELYITEFGTDITSRCRINDTGYKAAVLVDAFMLLGQRVSGMGYWYLSDLSFDAMESNILLFGGNGLLSRNGIRKSGYHGLSFLKQQGKSLVDLGKNHMITCRNLRHYEILVHNCKELSQEYRSELFASSDPREESRYFADNSRLKLQISLKNMRPGRYKVVKHVIGSGYGDLEAAVREFNCSHVMRQSEQEYLIHTSVPLQRMDTVICDGTLHMEVELEENQVALYTLVFDETLSGQEFF